MDKANILIPKVRELLSRSLEKFGFEKDEKTEVYSGKIYERWIRDESWKIEEFRMIYPKEDKYFVDLALGVYLKISDREVIFLSGNTVNHLAGRNDVWYQFPDFFLNFRLKSFLNVIKQDSERALSWFNKFHSPTDCIEEIISDRTNVGEKGAKNYNLVLEFLNNIKEL
jgi:predicted transport protein